MGSSEEVTHLFFANDALMFYKIEESVLLDLICIPIYFQAGSSLSINFSKSELVRLGNRNNTTRLAKSWV